MIEGKDPFGYATSTYFWVVGLSVIAGIVKYLNLQGEFSWRIALRVITTSAFSGLVGFWLCEHFGVDGPLQAVSIAIIAVMGERSWLVIWEMLRMRLGMPPQQVVAQVQQPATPMLSPKHEPVGDETGSTP
jgi:uncharacterized membrane protein YfcA